MAIITEHDVIYAGNKKIHYLATGPENGPMIFFLHGWPATAITWKPQIDTFSSLGFRVVAPDMPGYGKSTARRVADDYTQEALVEGMRALLQDTGRNAAIWVGHDWGAGVTSSLAAQYPDTVKALINLCVPYRTIEMGWETLIPLLNRDVYPSDTYEFGQWDYMRNFEENFEKAVAWPESNVAGLCKGVLQPSQPPSNPIADFATVRQKGWMGGLPTPPTVEMTGPPILEAEAFASYVEDMEKTGFWPGSAYYLHHDRNAKYHARTTGKLEQPVLFVHAAWDQVCDTKTSRLAEPMRHLCANLTEVTVEAGHWLQIERASEVNAALCRFIVEQLPTEWPGFWGSGYTTSDKRSTL